MNLVASDELEYGFCDCEYPCSCVRFRGIRYGSWRDVLNALGLERDNFGERLEKLTCRHEFGDGPNCTHCGLHASVIEGGALSPENITKAFANGRTITIG